MPREIARKPRFIYPQVATSLSLAKISALAELLFWRILPQADDQGRLSGDPVHIKAIACPIRDEFTRENIPELLKELESAELIIRYSASSEPVIQIAKWWGYQSGMRRIFPSHYPPPRGWQDRIKGVAGTSNGQMGTPSDAVPPIVNIVNIPEVNIPEPEEGTATPTTETAIESKSLETHEGSTGATETAKESELLRFLETLEGWRFRSADDLIWLREFCQDWPDFNLSLAKACRDWHSGRALSAKHKGVWKNRFRNWMEQERKRQDDRKGGVNGADKKHPAQDKTSAGKRRDIRGPLR